MVAASRECVDAEAEQSSPPIILVVDDFVENTRILEKFLRPRGYNVVSVQTGEAALGVVDTAPPDLILLDLMMPGLDGFEVCQRLKQNRATQHIPIIIITGISAKDANVRSLEAGADDFLVKPFDSVLLAARIRSSLRSKRLQDQIIAYQKQLLTYNETLEERVRQRMAQVIRTQEVAVFSLAKLSESRDTETGAHLERIRDYARTIAQELAERGMGEAAESRFVDQIFLSSPLHDIGKVGIPDRILLKPGKLTEQEFEVMKTHTVIGGDTLRAADLEAGQDSFLAMGRDIAYYHHERWDGKGYPKGLKGTEPPLAARITAVSDVYDALTSKRPYKEPFSHQRSRDIIVEGRGTQFDPEVVDAFLAREEQVIAIRRRLFDLEALSPILKLNRALEQAEQNEAASSQQ